MGIIALVGERGLGPPPFNNQLTVVSLIDQEK
jgi:hypothetical protein